MTLKKALSKKLSKKQLALVPASFDVVGDIAIIEVPSELASKEKLLGETLLALHKTIKVVCKKVGIHAGEFRRQKLRIMAGERRKETLYKENNVRLKLNPEKVYFSVRLSGERKRIAAQVKSGESVLVMFGGVAPYAAVISKNASPKEVYSIEKNLAAHEYAVENIKMNKLTDVHLYHGDVRRIIPKLRKKFDRIIMPLPKSAGSFLDVALFVARKNTTIHFYDFLHIDEFHKAKEKIHLACLVAKKKCRILRTIKCGQHAPRVFRICVDFKVV